MTGNSIDSRISAARSRIAHLRYLAGIIEDSEARRALIGIIREREDRLHSMVLESTLVRLAEAYRRKDSFNDPGVWLKEFLRIQGERAEQIKERRA